MRIIPEKVKSQGMTVVEMLIAIFIFSLILSGSISLIGYIYRNYGYAMEQGMSVATVQRSMKIMIREIRGACQSDNGSYPILLAEDFSFVFFADIDKDDDVERIRYFVENETLKKGKIEPEGIPAAYPDENEEISVISEHIVNTAEQPVFYYFNTDYPADQENNPLSTPVTPLAVIRLAKIDIYFNLDPNRRPDNIRLESFVELRNLKDNW